MHIYNTNCTYLYRWPGSRLIQLQPQMPPVAMNEISSNFAASKYKMDWFTIFPHIDVWSFCFLVLYPLLLPPACPPTHTPHSSSITHTHIPITHTTHSHTFHSHMHHTHTHPNHTHTHTPHTHTHLTHTYITHTLTRTHTHIPHTPHTHTHIHPNHTHHALTHISPLVSAALSVAFAWQARDLVHCKGVGCTPWRPLRCPSGVPPVSLGLRRSAGGFCVAGVGLGALQRARRCINSAHSDWLLVSLSWLVYSLCLLRSWCWSMALGQPICLEAKNLQSDGRIIYTYELKHTSSDSCIYAANISPYHHMTIHTHNHALTYTHYMYTDTHNMNTAHIHHHNIA